MKIIDELEELKKHLLKNVSKFNEHHSWLGDTEGGFYSADEFDMEKLLQEIDAFGQELRDKAKAAAKPPASV